MRQQITKMEFIHLLQRQFQTLCPYPFCCDLAKNATHVSPEMAQFVLKIAHLIWLFRWNQSQ